MGSSQETFGKKDKENRKKQKRKDKERKQELRNANSNKGKGLDAMMAYVDENGNLSETPPDPKKAAVIDAADIAVSVTKKEDIQVSTHKGKLTYFNAEKAYGFITDLKTQERVFVHQTSFVDPIELNEKIVFETEKTVRGLVAINVRKAQ